MSRVLMGVTGGISAYKVCELVRLLVKADHEVKVILTRSAESFVGKLTFMALSNDEVFADDVLTPDRPMLHIELAKWADKIIIVPATAHSISAFVQGAANTLVTAVMLATKASRYIVPAMNQAMWHHPATQCNLKQLIDFGYDVLQPAVGEQACGDVGLGRMPEPDAIFNHLFQHEKRLSGFRVLVTAGPTYEKLDPIRYLGNLSSGKMGYALARVFSEQGADVVLVSGPTSLPDPAGVKVLRISSAQEMLTVVRENIVGQQLFICAAAIANYTFVASGEKIKSDDSTLTLTLTRTTDILKTICAENPDIFSVGFCAESKDIEESAKAKLNRKGCHAIIANKISGDAFPFGSEQNEAIYVTQDCVEHFDLMDKNKLAERIVEKVISQCD